jgi:3-phosphoshikimate 1-carboxyvinyltransferase
MIVTISPSNISGNVYAPASKSSMQRACAAGLLSEGETIICIPGRSNDDQAALDVIQKLGAVVTRSNDNKLLIKANDCAIKSSANKLGKEKILNCGESGLGLRMFAPIAALSHHEIMLNGSGSLLQRPMHFFDEIFPQLGISIQSNNGKLPIKIKGPLQPQNISIDGSLSSQFLTGLLMAYAKACTAPVSIEVENLKSKPYIDLTLHVLKHFGWHVENRDYKKFFFDPMHNTQPTTHTYTVEGDWSGASFLLVAGAIAGNISIEGLDMESAQADKAILNALKIAGAEISFSGNKILIQADKLKGFDFDATDCPDLFPPLVALAAYCKGTTTIKGVSRLAHKESNRALTLKNECEKMGVVILLQDDVMVVESKKKPVGATVHSHHDHRIAMACAVAALQAEGDTVILNAEAINKSYPDFYFHLKTLNTSMQIT